MKDKYQRLAIELFKSALNNKSARLIARQLEIRPHRVGDWLAGKTPIRASLYAFLLSKKGLNLEDIASAIVAPRVFPKQKASTTPTATQKNFIAPLLKEIRGERTLREVGDILRLKTPAAYNHWESARRDIPLHTFLEAIDQLSSRLHTFCEVIGFEKNLSKLGFPSHRKDFSEKFFTLPWTPTVFLALQTSRYESQLKHSSAKLARQLNLSIKKIDDALHILADLELVTFDGALYRHRKGQFYAPPTLSKSTLERLNLYWFSQSKELYSQPGLHKIEEHALSIESLEKIKTWVAELRERIREEVKTSTPETVAHIHWQVSDMLP